MAEKTFTRADEAMAALAGPDYEAAAEFISSAVTFAQAHGWQEPTREIAAVEEAPTEADLFIEAQPIDQAVPEEGAAAESCACGEE